MAFLTANDSGRRYELTTGECILGRHPDCNVVIEVGAVSRHHAKILCKDRNFLLEDLRSRNHTFLNDTDIFEKGPQKLRDGDKVSVCDVHFTFHDDVPRKLDESDNSRFPAILVDDDSNSSGSTIMSKLGVTSSRGRIQLTASPETRLNALLEITRNLGNALALDDVLPKVLNSLFTIFVQADRGFIGLKNEAGLLIPRWSKARREDAQDTIRISRTIVNQVMESQQAILSADAANDERFEMSQSIADFRIRSMMCAPLVDIDGESMGVLQIDTLDQRKRFQQEDLEVLASVATQAGIAIDNARMHERALRQREFERDLQLAHEVQRGFLPISSPKIEGYRFFDYYEPANHVGGDYFDYITLPDRRTAVVVADVVGHGVAAALLMAKLSAEARFCLASEDVPAAAVTKLNERLSQLKIERFVTLVLAVLDPGAHSVIIVNAGHMAPIHRRADGSIDEPGQEDSGLPLGITDGIEYRQKTIELKPGESLTMYTDGINESVNVQGEFFGIDRVRRHVTEGKGVPEVIRNSIVEDVRRFIGTGAQEDDMCLVAFGRTR